jgi:Bacteriophage tail sheath protein
MPSALTYPGVYVEEIPSGVRTITGVATSVAAFVGRAKSGPTSDPITINGFGDYERIFGGLSIDSPMSYAVRDFYLNGGAQAIIVRLYHGDPPSPPAANPPKPAKAMLDVDTLGIEAASEGSWANKLRARVDYDVVGPDAANLFNLSIRNDETGDIEVFRNVSVVPTSPRRVDKVLENESRFVRAVAPLPALRPAASGNVVDPGKTIWDDNAAPGTNSKVLTADEASDGADLDANDFTGPNLFDQKRGLYALRKADLFNLLCIPPYLPAGDVDTALVGEAAVYCEQRRAMLLVDPPSTWTTKDQAKNNIGNVGTSSKNAALFFPRLKQFDPLKNNQLDTFVPCGAVAGVFARTDTNRGVWKAPAGLDATLVGVPALSVPLTDRENGELNPLGINCLRSMVPAGRIVWGSRTLQGDDRFASEWKYIPVRRTALFIEESLYRGTQWVVFEPNDEPLWAQIRLNVGAFMHNLFRQGAFQGTSPREAYFVKCDHETTTQNDINLGIVNIVVGFAPLKPAEFVIIKLQQIAGQIEV